MTHPAHHSIQLCLGLPHWVCPSILGKGNIKGNGPRGLPGVELHHRSHGGCPSAIVAGHAGEGLRVAAPMMLDGCLVGKMILGYITLINQPFHTIPIEK